MANTSILAAFERMWQHITNRLSGKADLTTVETLIGEDSGKSVKEIINENSNLVIIDDWTGDLYSFPLRPIDICNGVAEGKNYLLQYEGYSYSLIETNDGSNGYTITARFECIDYVSGGIGFQSIILMGDPNDYNNYYVSTGERVCPTFPSGTSADYKLTSFDSSTNNMKFINAYIAETSHDLGNLGVHSDVFLTLGGDGNGQTTYPIQLLFYYSHAGYEQNNYPSFYSDIFHVGQDGTIVGKNLTANSADYAEYFEWEDGNTEEEDRRGLLVSFGSEGGKIQIADQSTEDEIIGIISTQPCVIGNAAPTQWKNKYLTDAFGKEYTQEIECPEILDEEGNVIQEAHTLLEPILNPDFDPEVEYVPRESRPEWALVGLLGQIVVCDDGTCEVGKYCVCGEGGKATASEGRNGWRVLERIDESHVKVFFK